MDRCNKHCIVACVDTTYSQLMSFAHWPATKYKSLAIDRDTDNMTLDDIRIHYAKLTVFIDNLNIEQYVTSAKYENIYLFVTQIGGALGLFTGFSLLSSVEIIELVFDLWVYLCTSLFHFVRRERTEEKSEVVNTGMKKTYI